jgi:capsular polysaccharide biosynthesis protein
VEKHHFYMIRRWLWLLVLASLVSSGTAYIVLKDRPAVYEAQSRLLVGPGIDTPDPDLNALRAGGQLMQTYAELVVTGPFLQSIIDKLNLNLRPDTLVNMIDVKTNQETQILSIQVQSRDPDMAMAIANAVADRLVLISPSGPESPTALLNDQMRQQVGKLEKVIDSSEAKIEELESNLSTLTEADSQGLIVLQTNDYLQKQQLIIDQLSQERGRLSDALNALTLLYDSLRITPTNQVKIVEYAASSELVVSQLRLSVLIAGAAGLVLAILLALAFEFFDDTLKSKDELVIASGGPLLGAISKTPAQNHQNASSLVVKNLPNSESAEDYRLLGTKLLSRIDVRSNSDAAFSEDQNSNDIGTSMDRRRLRSILVADTYDNDKNGEVAANLAVVLSETGKKVILVDANLRQSSLQKLFDIDASLGLADLLVDSSLDPNLGAVQWSDRLSVVPSGSTDEFPFNALASSRMVEIINGFEQRADIDVVIVSAPPFERFADSLILASRVAGTIIVAGIGETRQSVLDELIQSLGTLNVYIIGSVLNYNRPKRFLIPSFKDQKAANWNSSSKPIFKSFWGRSEAKVHSLISGTDSMAPVFAEQDIPGDGLAVTQHRNGKKSFLRNESFPIQATKN